MTKVAIEYPDRPRILIVRLSAIGDVVHATPVLCALRKQFSTAHIAWVVEGRAGDLLEGHRALDELIRIPRRWLKSPAVVWDLRRRLRRGRFDIAIDVQGLSKSAIAAWLSGARRRIGFAPPDGRELSGWLNNVLVPPESTHVIDRNLELLRPLGVERPEVAFDLPEDPLDAERTSRLIRDLKLASGFAVINPGAGWPSKVWPAERFADVARRLGEAFGLPWLVVWAGERQWAETIVGSAKGHAVLAPPTSLTELASLLRRADLLVAADTGPLHIGAAVGAPCVGLFGPMPRERNGPYGKRHIAIQAARLASGSRARRQADNATMRAITAEMVATAGEEILRRRHGAARHEVA